MTRPLFLLAALPLTLAACDATMAPAPSGTSSTTVPENIAAMAAPYQNLSSARVDEATGCYVYLHRGPVESTYLPLRTADGRPICTSSMASVTEAN
ncbi:hypothetical protein [Maritimibacter dapengensis]|uniref:Lipoprotein n=1 Tax=Maritimibacter dapengensis TaxID=2836868 RepID=A0ABS6T5Q7_9RHOB|nr:hypothetical protein [Maritimibacter dapengensis]MBV7380525.1 hypothetical protein [Maritimibacter dapengensis]